jgi:hypothetical protein
MREVRLDMLFGALLENRSFAPPGACIHAGMSRWPCSTRQTSTWSAYST